MPTVPDTTGARLKQLREQRGLKRQDVYDLIRDDEGNGLPTSTLEKWERDMGEPRASLAAKLARLYDVTLDYIFLLTDDPHGHRNGHKEEDA
jgi:transcriptional regulator with XRE-family HTH domain